jgi:hypothetical protein
MQLMKSNSGPSTVLQNGIYITNAHGRCLVTLSVKLTMVPGAQMRYYLSLSFILQH